MKKIFAVVLSSVLFFSFGCKEKKDGPFVVTGTVLNAPGKKIMLMEIPFSSPEPVILDSTTLAANGSFTLEANANEEGIYRLVLENGPDVILVNDTKTIKVTMDVNDYANYKVEESPASEGLHTLFTNYRRDDSVLLSTFKELDTLQKQNVSDSVLTLVKARRDTELERMNNRIKTFITETSSPAATFYAIGLASRTMPPEALRPMVDKAGEKYKEHAGIARIKSLIAQQSATATPAYPLLNQQAPNLTMPDVSGKPVSIDSYKGKYVLIDFWASWCAPCRAENPNVVSAYNKYSNKNFTILGVSLDQDKEAWKKAIAKDQLTWSHMSDLKMWDSEAVNAYALSEIPFNVLVDPTGKIIASSLRGEELHMKLAEVLK